MGILNNLAQYEYELYEYDYSTTTTGTEVDGAVAAAVFASFFLFFLIFAIIGYVLTGIFLGKIFKKAGLASWPAWVPFYNIWKLLEIGGQPGFWAVLTVIPFVNIVSAVFTAIAMYHIGLKLGKSGAFVLLGIFLPIVWIIWLGADKSTWNESKSSAPNLAKGPKPTPAT